MELVCLANSRKLGGRCIAGKTLVANRVQSWIRPVGATTTGELIGPRCCYADGTEPKLLEIIELQLAEHTPHSYQTENWQLGAGAWKRAGFVQAVQLPLLADKPRGLWPTGHHTQLGRNDRIPEALAAQEKESLYLVRVQALHLEVSENPFKQKQQVHGRFSYNGLEYVCKVTDPIIEQRCVAKGLGSHALGDRYLTLSLGEPFQGYVYKLIAAVFS